ncbi:MAG TPA: nucleotide pyrophosphohydrolase [Flavihumibacter sp.]
MSKFERVIKEVIQFRDERDWEQFHNSKDLALAISIEAAELNELFLWKKPEQVDPERLKDELADILTFCIILAHQNKLDIPDIIRQKLNKNAKKYPVDKSKGTAKKYTEL